MSGTHLGTHCGGVRVRIGGGPVNNMCVLRCNEVVINLTVPFTISSDTSKIKKLN